MSSVSLYRLRDVRKRHSPAFTLEIPELDVIQGEVLGLVGPTGAGKSTLLRLLAGLQSADSGQISYAGNPFHADLLSIADRRSITLVAQRPLLLTGTVGHNVEFGLRLRKIRNRKPAVAAVLASLGVSDLVDRSARTLSGGQIQLVALARAVVLQPRILLLDEPTANLDPGHVALVEETLQQLRQQTGMTMVWATHHLFQARRISTRAALFLNGRVVEVSTARDFFESPNDPRTSAFVQGRMIY